ncbi:hypothetical protein KI655_01580 [Vibrio sp. D404a]|uniref:GapS6b family protein n=1 Tax=unclassified Vibrio TaxID=2614977 RepID=UPI0025569411|nr:MULTISPECIES: hypothetical protein [unclassified Vibrio]MDK9735979.1 hypothetical protein [Vibrio sp. D404a]MDK9797855.1 hypothetical protein [Vibrio sp. D449a]
MADQEHYGSGDNIAGNKSVHIIHSIQARDLMRVVEGIMQDIRFRDLYKARENLQALNDINSLEEDVRLLLNALSLKVELIACSDLPSKSEILSLLRQGSLPENIREVVTSILIDLESRTSESNAISRYLDLDIKGEFVKEVFYERLASNEELNDTYHSTKPYDFSEQELTGLVRGALRTEEFALAVEIAQLLKDSFSSDNAKVLLLVAETCFLTSLNLGKPVISFSKTDKNQLDALTEQLLARMGKHFEVRLLSVLINLLNLYQFSDVRLFELGELYLEQIKGVNPECAKVIEQLSKSENSLEVSTEPLSGTLDLEAFSRLDFAVQAGKVKISSISNWVDHGGVVRTDDEYTNSFANLYLSALVCSDEDKKKLHELDSLAQSFFEADSQRFKAIPSHAILRLCERFVVLGLPLQAVQFLTPFLSEDAWVSPFFQCYLDALFACEKFELLLSKVAHLAPKDKTITIYLREAQTYERLNEYQLAIESAYSATRLEPNLPYPWHLLLHATKENGAETAELRKIVFEIPDDVFLDYDDSKVPLINEIAISVDANLADKVLVDWFAKDPDRVASALTQIYFNSIQSRSGLKGNPYTPKHCLDGVTYSDGFETFTRLLVQNVVSEHPLLLDVDSPLGQALNEIPQGSTIGDYTMVERLPPYIAAHRHAANIRHRGNDGSDPFKIYSLPSNNEDLIPYVERILRRHSPQEDAVNETLKNPNVPLMLRGHYTDRDQPVRGAIKHLSTIDSDSAKYAKLFARGEDEPKKVIIDVYTVVYLSLMGFSSAFCDLGIEVVLSQHTERALDSWVQDVLRDDYLSMGLTERGVYRVTSQEIQRDCKELIGGIRAILNHANVETLKVADTPDVLIKMRDMVDETVYSTLQLSFANDIPLLCVDHIMAELGCGFGCPTVNMNNFVEKILTSLSYEERKRSIQMNLLSGTPSQILYQDVLELSRSSKNADVYLVYKFIEKYSEAIKATNSPLDFLTQIVRNVIAVAYIDGAILRGGRLKNPTFDGYAEYVFNSCSRLALGVLDGQTAEEKFATLVFNVIDTHIPAYDFAKLVASIGSDFAQGHFLNVGICNDALVACHKAKYMQ